MPAERLLPTQEAEDLIALVKEIARDELKPHAADAEENEKFPRDAFRLLGRSGLLGLPYAEEFGGGEQPYEVYLQALEEIASAWMTVAVGLSVHVMSCYGLATFGTREQQDRWLPEMLEGELLGGYALSEVQAGSDPAAMSTRAIRQGSEYVVNGTKAWITHAGAADFYTLMARTSPTRAGASPASSPPARPRASPPPRPSARWASPAPSPRNSRSTTCTSAPTA